MTTAANVYVTRRLPEPALEILREAGLSFRVWPEEGRPVPRDVLLQEVRDCDGLLCLLTDRVDEELLRAAPRLRVVANTAAGLDNVDLAACTRRGVMVTHTPNVLTETVADLAWALLLAAARRVVEAHKTIEAGGWNTWSLMFMTGQDVYGRTLGIVGAGRIGGAVARRARGFGMRVLYHNRRRNEALERETGAEYRGFDELLEEADFVVCLVPLTEETRGLFGYEQFRRMKRTAVFVNVARGAVVREADLERALREGLIWAAGLDVFEREPIGPDHPLFRLPNCVCLPHIGSATVATRLRMATLAAANLVAGLSGRRPLNLANPEALGRSGS
ncbi:MAG: D-glycerate dehydrogenase [Clostridia bacterium]|nr:D-glycerate dehydrogenase [Clostridia bacterium]